MFKQVSNYKSFLFKIILKRLNQRRKLSEDQIGKLSSYLKSRLFAQFRLKSNFSNCLLKIDYDEIDGIFSTTENFSF